MSRTKAKKALKLDLGCGQHVAEGFEGVDLWDGPEVTWAVDLTKFPWPWDDNSVEAIHSSHYVEHTLPVGGPHDGLIAFMDEVWRICKPDAKVQIIHPYLKSNRAFQDPTHTRFIPEDTWYYFAREWREQQGLDHYPIRCDFKVDNIGNTFYPGMEHLHHEALAFRVQNYWNVVADLAVDLTALKK